MTVENNVVLYVLSNEYGEAVGIYEDIGSATLFYFL